MTYQDYELALEYAWSDRTLTNCVCQLSELLKFLGGSTICKQKEKDEMIKLISKLIDELVEFQSNVSRSIEGKLLK